ncbi:MAG: Maf family protein [Dehalococcoidia bacterium]
MRKIVLASASPRRQELLKQIGLKFEVDPGNCEEVLRGDIEPAELAKSLSHQKAQAVAQKHPDAIVIAADTFIVAGKSLMGKARSEAEAREMLTELSGKSHSVITGFTIIDTLKGKVVSQSVETKVWFRRLSEEEIDAYVKCGEPIGKAGAYAIQGLGSVIVERIEGDYSNVVGLPLTALAEALKGLGIPVL